MNPISLNVYHAALYTVGTLGGWLSANPVLCIGIVYGFMGTQSLHLVHVLAARAFYMHGNLLGGVCIGSMLLGQAVLVTIEFWGWAQPLAIRWRYNAAFVTAIYLFMCLVGWVIPRDPITSTRTDLKIFTPLMDLPNEVKSVRDPRVFLYSILCTSLYVLIPRGGASFVNDLTSVLGFSHGTKPVFLWGTLLGYGIGNLFFYVSLFLSRSITSLVTKRTFYQLISPLSRVLGGMVYATMFIQFQTSPFEIEFSLMHLREARTQTLLVAQDRVSDWVPSIAKQRLALYGRVYQMEEEMGAFNQLLLRSLVDEKNSLQSVNLLPDLCEQPVLKGRETEIEVLPTTGLSPSISSETRSDGESFLKEEGATLLEKQALGLNLLIQPTRLTPQEYVEESRGFAFPWEKKDLAHRLGPLFLPKGRVLGSWHTYGVGSYAFGSKADKPSVTVFSADQEEQRSSSRFTKKTNTDWEQDILLPSRHKNFPFPGWWGWGGTSRKRQKQGLVQQQNHKGLLPKVPANLKVLPWDSARKRKPKWAASSERILNTDIIINLDERRKSIAYKKLLFRHKIKPRFKLKHESLKGRLQGFPIKTQRTREKQVLYTLGTALQPPNDILLTHVPLQANSEQVQRLFEGHTLERLKRVFQLWERRSTSNALLLFKQRTKGWFSSEDVYQDVVQRLFSPSEALFDYCVRLMAYAQHQRAFACVMRPQTHLAWTELERAPRLCLSIVPGLAHTRPGYQVQERITDIYVYLYGKKEEAQNMMKELRLPSFSKERNKGNLAARRLGKPQILAILESRMLRQRARQGRRVPLRLESEGRLTPSSSIPRRLHYWTKELFTHIAGFLAEKLSRRNSSKATSSFRPTRPLHSYAKGQRWANSPDARLPTGPPGQFPFLLVPRLLEALSNQSLQPSDRRLPFPQLRSLVQAPGLQSSRLGPRSACHRPGLLSRSMDPITTNLVATTPAPQGPGDRARRQALRKQALLPKHQGRKLEWATRKIARTLDQHSRLSTWKAPRLLKSPANAWRVQKASRPIHKRMKSWQLDMLILKRIVHTQAFQLLNQLFRLVGQWNDQFSQELFQKTAMHEKGFFGRTPDKQKETHLKSLSYKKRVESHLGPTFFTKTQVLRNRAHRKTEKKVSETLSFCRVQKEREARQEVFDLRVSLQSLREVSRRTHLSSSVPWIFRQALFHAKEKEMAKSAWCALYKKSGTWVGPTPFLSPLPMPIFDSWHHRRARIQLLPLKHTLLGEPSKTHSWSGFGEAVQKERTATWRASNEIGIVSALEWVGPLEDRWSNLWRQQTSGVTERGRRMLLALHRSQWDKRSLLYNPLPPLLGKKLRTQRHELAKLSSKKLPRYVRRQYTLPLKTQAIATRQNRENNLRLMLTHSLRLASLRLYEQEGRKALASLAGVNPLSLFADDERVLALVRLDDSRVDPSMRRRAWGARYRLALGRMLARGNKQRHSLESLKRMTGRTHRYRTWDSTAQKYIPQSELANLGLSTSHRQGQALKLFPPAFSFGEEIERSQMIFGLFDTGIQPYEKGVPIVVKRKEKGGAKRPARSRNRRKEGKVSEKSEKIRHALRMEESETINSPSFLFKPESVFFSLDDFYECSKFWRLQPTWWGNIDHGKHNFIGVDKWRNKEERVDEYDQANSLPFRKIFHHHSYEETRNPSRARIVAEEWFAQSSLPAGERKAYLDEQKERIEKVENRKQKVIPSLKDKSLRQAWHRRISRPVNKINEADRWRGLISKKKYHYPIGPIARFYLGHSGLPEEKVLGHVAMDPHIDDAEPKEVRFNMPKPEVVAEMEKQHLPRLSRWALGELRSRIETDDTQEGVRKDIMRRAWERGDAARWATRSGSPPDLEAILEYEADRADEQSGTDRLHTSALDQVAIRDLYLMKRIMRRLRLAIRLASLHLQSSWLKSSNPQRMRRPTLFEKTWAWADFWRFHGMSSNLFNQSDKNPFEEPMLPVPKTDSSGTERGFKGKIGEVTSITDLLDAAESLTFWGTNAEEGLPTVRGLKPLKEPGLLGAMMRSSSQPLAQSMDKALTDPFLVKPLFTNQRDRLRELRARQAHLERHSRRSQVTKQRYLGQKYLQAQRIQPSQGLKHVEELPAIQSWKPKMPVRRLGLSGYLVGVRRHIEWSQGHQLFLPYLRPSLGLVGSNADRPTTRTTLEEEFFQSAEMRRLQKIKEFLPTYEHRSPWRQLWDEMFGRESMRIPYLRIRRLKPGLLPRRSYQISRGFLGIPRLVKPENSLGRGVSPSSLRQYKSYPTILEPLYRNTQYFKRKGKRKRIGTFLDSDFENLDYVNLKKFIPRNNDSEQIFFSLSSSYETFQKHPDWDLFRRGISFAMDMERLARYTKTLEYDLRGKDGILVLVDRYSYMIGGVWLGKFVEITSRVIQFNLGVVQGMFRSFMPLLPTSDSKVYLTFMILGKPQLIYQPSNKGFFSWNQYERKVRKGKWKKIPSFVGTRERSSHFSDHMIAVRIKNPFQALQLALQAFVHNPWKALNEIEVKSFLLPRNDYDNLNYYRKLYKRVYPPDNSSEGLRKYYNRFIRRRKAVTKQLWRFFGFTRVPYHDLPYINKRIPSYFLKTYGQVPGVKPWWLGMDLQNHDWVVKAGSSKAQNQYVYPIQVITDQNWRMLQLNNPRGFQSMSTLANKMGRRRAKGLPHYTSIKDFAFRGELYDSDELIKPLRKKVAILDGQTTQHIDEIHSKKQFSPEPQPQQHQPEPQPQQHQPEPQPQQHQPEPQPQQHQPEPQPQQHQPELSDKESLNSYEELYDPEGLEYEKKDQNGLFSSGLIRRSLALWKKLAPDSSRQRMLRRMNKIRRRALGHKLHLWVERLWQHSSYSLQVPLPLLNKLGQGLIPNQSYTDGVMSRFKALKQREREARKFALSQERAKREVLAGLIQHEPGKAWRNQIHLETLSLKRGKPKMRETLGSLKEKAHTLSLPIQDSWNSLAHVARFFVLHWREEGWNMLSPWRQAKLWDEVRLFWRQPSYGLIPDRIEGRPNKSSICRLGIAGVTLSYAEEALPSGSVSHSLVRQVQAMSYLTNLRNIDSTIAMAVLEGSRLLHQDSSESQAFDTKLYSIERKKVERSMSLAGNLAQAVDNQLSRREMTRVERNCLKSCKRCLEKATACLAKSAVLNPQEVWEKDSMSFEEWAIKWESFALRRSGFNLTDHSKGQLFQFNTSLPQREREALILKQKSTIRDKAFSWHTAEIERLVHGICSAALHLSEFQRQKLIVLFQGLALDIHNVEEALKNPRGLKKPMNLAEGKRLWSRRDPRLREKNLRSMPVQLREAALVCLSARTKSMLSSSLENNINRRLRLYARHRKEMLQAYRESQKALERTLLEVPEVIERAVTGLRESRSGLEEALDLLRLFMDVNEIKASQVETSESWVREDMAKLMVALYDLSLPSRQLAHILQQEATKSIRIPVSSSKLHATRDTRRLHTPWGLAVRSLPKVEIPLEVEWQLRTLSKEIESLSYNKHLRDRLSLEKRATLDLLDSESSTRLEKLKQQMPTTNKFEVINEIDKNPRMMSLVDALAYVKKVSTSRTSPAQRDLVLYRVGFEDPVQFEIDYYGDRINDYNYYGVEPWDSTLYSNFFIMNKIRYLLTGNVMPFQRRGEYVENVWTWGKKQPQRKIGWQKNEESVHMEFLHWHTVQNIRAWRALMGNSTKALGKSVMLDIHTPLDPVLFMGPVQPQGLSPSLHRPLPREIKNPEMVKMRTARLDNRRHEEANQVRTRDLVKPLPRMKVRTLGWAMGVVQRKFVYSPPPPPQHAIVENNLKQQGTRHLGKEARQGIALWQCQAIGAFGQPIRPKNTLSGTNEENRLARPVLLYPHELYQQIYQWIFQLTTWANRTFRWLKTQIKTLSYLPAKLFQLTHSNAQDGSQHRSHPFQTWAQVQPTWKLTGQSLQSNVERKPLAGRLPAKELSPPNHKSASYGADRNKQDRLFASKALLHHMLSSRKSHNHSNLLLKNIVSSSLEHIEQEDPVMRRKYERKVRHVGNRLPEPVPLQPFFSQWMDLQVSKLKRYEDGPSVARTMEISTKDLYMTSMGTLARPMAHQMSYSFHGLPEHFIQKAMYSLRTWRASKIWWRTRYYFPEKPYQQTWRERLKPLRRALRDVGFEWMLRWSDRIWRAEMLGRKAGIPQLGRIELRKLLVKSIHSEFKKQPERFKLWARNKAYQLVPKSLLRLVPRSYNKPNRKNK
uniref:hypothetical chloroplast RF1 n=1 Tax=Klebsormidium subtilissimum TaxID=184584 RepID=UPI00286B02AA|nr:hypothetical chloroplast RF1 [Klebsormidium subtilissimum]YP_010933144.1 hypothetical chloroplast RF1 [Klebsormidium subtilissimum]WKT08090.1 hypothetical chloroplast RF1 [Klebsormidium subtilissimum]WKT08091.1 hypothetical chloroplast RF1 [Klebsormidium subtilissimum]